MRQISALWTDHSPSHHRKLLPTCSSVSHSVSSTLSRLCPIRTSLFATIIYCQPGFISHSIDAATCRSKNVYVGSCSLQKPWTLVAIQRAICIVPTAVPSASSIYSFGTANRNWCFSDPVSPSALRNVSPICINGDASTPEMCSESTFWVDYILELRGNAQACMVCTMILS